VSGHLIDPQDPRWSQLLARVPHDFYHLPEYLAFSARYEGGRAAAFYAENGEAALLIPLLIRPIPAELGAEDGWYDVASPYGFPSPILAPTTDKDGLSYLLRLFKQVCAAHGVISAFLRLHPLLPLPADALAEQGTLIRHGRTIAIDLMLSREELWLQTCRNHRQNIRQLKRKGFVAEMDRWELYSEFFPIYWQTMERCAADKFYFFSDRYLQELRETLGERVHLCTVLSQCGEVAAAGLFTSVTGIVQAHLAGTANKYLPHAPSKLMFEHACRWAKDTGHRILHLGGGVGGCEDSLFQFKAGFSNLRNDFYTYRMILDDEKYRVLEQHNRNTHSMPDFFPIYRSPVH
jgi:hypothetical protein